MTLLRPTILNAGCVVLLLLMSGCDTMETQEPEEDLDTPLVELLTREGQRPLANFILPDSDDLLAIPQDPKNPLTPAKVELGRLLFHETALATNPRHESARGTYSCATCHHAGAGFQAGLQQAIGDGGEGWGANGEDRRANLTYDVSELDVQPIRSPTILNGAYQQVMGWAGEFGATGRNAGTDHRWTSGTPVDVNRLGYEGLETQAIAALGVHRMDVLENSVLETNPAYVEMWERAFPGRGSFP